MQRICMIKLALQTFLLYVILVQNVSPKAIGRSRIKNHGLYNESDHVVILNATNLRSSVYGSKNAWLVEFYNSWCGFCHRFAPTWKAFAQDVLTWRDVVTVAAIDCADDDNNPICREYEVMHYPMVKYFHVNAPQGDLGKEMEKANNQDILRQNLIDLLEKEQLEGRGATWPNIVPYRSTELKNLWRDVPESVRYFFLIIEAADSFLGTELILDLHNVHSLQLRSVTSDNEPLTILLNVNKFPALIALNRDGVQEPLNPTNPTREDFTTAIREFMNSKGIIMNVPDIMEVHFVESQKPEEQDPAESMEDKQEDKQEDDEIASFGDTIFQLDLETALRYSMNHEIPMVKLIEGERMEALKAYFNLLAKYFPLRRSGVLLLDVIRNIADERNSITGEELSRIVKATEEEMSPIYSGPQKWIGCKGSVDTLRGYPCGLWTMFHMLTVNAANQNKGNLKQDPTEVLRVMHAYIKNFFGCADCAQHFVEMAARKKIFGVRNVDESILWLWRSHNEVNERLSGEDTEDPKHKKIQYPSKEHCPLCRDINGSWDEEEVLRYLKKKYSYSEINYYGSSGKPVKETDDSKVREGRLVSYKHMNQRKTGWDFTIFDISICVVLYVMSAAILVLVCIKFAVKRTYRKKAYVLDLFGKA